MLPQSAALIDFFGNSALHLAISSLPPCPVIVNLLLTACPQLAGKPTEEVETQSDMEGETGKRLKSERRWNGKLPLEILLEKLETEKETKTKTEKENGDSAGIDSAFHSIAINTAVSSSKNHAAAAASAFNLSPAVSPMSSPSSPTRLLTKSLYRTQERDRIDMLTTLLLYTLPLSYPQVRG